MPRVAGIDAACWSDKSRKVMLPALQVLIEIGAMTLGAAQPALAVLLRRPASTSSGYTASDLAQAIKRLGVAGEAVVALPPDAIALPASAPAPMPAAPPADLPRAIPGLTNLMQVPAASPLTASIRPAPAQPRERGGVAQGEWQMPAKLARNESRHAPLPEMDASWPTWSAAGMNTATSWTTTTTTTSSSTVTSSSTNTSTSTTRPARKEAQAKHKPAPNAAKARPQKPAQQWFALLKNKKGINLKQLQDLARIQHVLVNKNDESGRNALFYALAAGNEKVVAWILAHEAHVAPAQTARFVELLMDEVILYSPAFGAALRRFLGAQSAAVRQELHTHFVHNPPVMKGVEDILAAHGLNGSKQAATKDTSSSERIDQRMHDQVANGMVEQGRIHNDNADQATAEDLYKLGVCYEQGMGVAKDEARAVLSYRKAAAQGSASAENALGRCYKLGIGVEKDEKEAFSWHRLAAEHGHVKAYNDLSWCYLNGSGVTRNEKEAVRLFRHAAKQGDAAAQYNLGTCYAIGTGVASDKKEAVRWYRMAAEQGHANAQYNLGVSYVNGSGVASDENEAVRWFYKAAKQGHAVAQSSLGTCYEIGSGVARDQKEAVRWYRLAAEQGQAAAQFNLGWCYINGLGVAKNEKEAVRWYRLAAEQGDAAAQSSLGWYYANGSGVAMDGKEAVRWYRLAAEQGHADDQYNLGACYANGSGVAMDDEEAARWFRMAARQGHVDAQEQLKKLLPAPTKQ